MDTSEVPESSSTNIKFDDLWVQSIIRNFGWNFEDLPLETCFGSDWKTFKDFGTFNLEVTKISSTAFEVALNRKCEDISMPSDDGCYLKCNITVVGADKPRTVPMRFGEYRAKSIFQYDEIDNSTKDSKICTVLCVIKISETSVLSNEESKKQNKFIENLKTNDNAAIMEDMAFLLKRESLENIFTGRQKTDFVALKTGIIARTLPFAHEIAERVRNKQKNVKYEPKTSPQVYLGHIFDKDFKSINNDQLLILLSNAESCGLSYLVNEITDFLLFKAETEPEVLAYMLWLSELSCDPEIASKASRLFLENSEKILKSSAWNDMIMQVPITRCILDSIRRNFNGDGNLVLKLRDDIMRSVVEAWRKLVKENSTRKCESKEVQTSQLASQVGAEDAKQHPDEKQNTDKESKTQQNSSEESGGVTLNFGKTEASSNMERYSDELASSSEGKKIEFSSALEQSMASSNPDQYNRGFFPGAAAEDAGMERNFPVGLQTTAEYSNPELYSFDEPHIVSDGGGKLVFISTNNQPAVCEVSITGYSNDESNVKAVTEECTEETSDEKDEVESSRDQTSTDGSESAEGERLDGNSDEQKRPEKHSMEE